MQKLKNKLYELEFKIYSGLYNLMNKEDGDTNFISIAIVLVIVLVLAGIFVTFGKSLVPKLQQAINDFMSTL